MKQFQMIRFYFYIEVIDVCVYMLNELDWPHVFCILRMTFRGEICIYLESMNKK